MPDGRRPAGRLAAAALAVGALLLTVAAPPAAAAPFKWPRGRPLPPVTDITTLPGDRLVAARPLSLPGAGEDGTARFDVMSKGVKRTYLLAPARRVAPRRPPALVVLLPASNFALRTEYDRYGLDALRDHGLTVVIAGPYGADWNSGTCCNRPHEDGIDDVAAITTMRDDALRRSGADPHRVAVVGHSAGGLMAWTMACSPSFGAEVVVSVAGTLTGPCPALPDPPVFLDLHGSADATVPVEGSDRVSPELGIAPPSVRTSLSTLARSAGCGPVSSGGGTTRHTGCRGGGIVQLTVFAGAGHEWRDLDASRHVFPFLARHLPGVR